MAQSLGRWEQRSPFTDGEIFVGATDFKPTAASGAVTLVSSAAGLLTLNQAASLTGNLFADISKILRTGQYATPAYNQQNFGTAAQNTPGPSLVSNTSDPLALPPGFPPNKAAQLPPVTGGFAGPIPKGIQINSVDVIYEVDTGAITSVTFGLTKTTFPKAGTSAAPAVTNIIALGANSLPVAANTAGQVTTTNIAVASPAFVNAFKSEIIANINFVTPASNSVKFYGIILHVNFNYN